MSNSRPQGAQHTPGPWKVDLPGDVIRGGIVIAQIGGEWVEIADHLDHDDARLIAAAPEMKDELLTLLRCIEGQPNSKECLDDQWIEKAIGRARALLARIEGA